MARSGNFDLSCLFSTVKNTSGGSRVFGFLPPHGVQLAADEAYTVFGNILEAIGRGDRPTDERQRQALQNAVDAGDIEILSTPSIVLTDTVSGDVMTVALTSGSLVAVDPCWNTSDSLEVTAPP